MDKSAFDKAAVLNLKLMWADDGRFSMMRHADYLNAGTLL